MMLRSATLLRGFSVQATDGMLGNVDDLLFDDTTWAVRYLVVNTGAGLAGRKVLISPVAITASDWSVQTVALRVTKEEVRGSPEIDVEEPISIVQLDSLDAYYKWPASITHELVPVRARSSPRRATRAPQPSDEESEDTHLCSMRDWTGYLVLASGDHEIGHVEGFLFDDSRWRIRYITVNTRSWLTRRKTFIAPSSIRSISWGGSKIVLGITKESISERPPFDMDDVEEDT